MQITRSFVRIAALTALATCVAPEAKAQRNWIKNGDFAAGTSNWSPKGGGVAPKVESFSVNGLTQSASFGINPGRDLTATVPPPYILSQDLVLPAGPLELYADLALDAPGFNADGGTVSVRLAGVVLSKHAWGQVRGGTRRDVVCHRFVLKTGGKKKLEIVFDRKFGALRGRTPRNWIDNIALTTSPGPAFCFGEDRKPGLNVTLGVEGIANSAFAVFVAPKTRAALSIPGFAGTWHLELATTLPFFSGIVDRNGIFSRTIALPTNLTALQGVSLYFQPLGIAAGKGAFGIPHDYGLQK